MTEANVSELFVLGDPLGSRAFRGEVVSRVDTFALTRAESTTRDPVVVKHDRGGTLYDVVWTTSVAPIIVSNRVIDLLQDNHVTGWGSYAVELRDKAGERVEGYIGLSIVGRCGPIRDELSPTVDAVYPGGRVSRHQGWYFDPDTWDGSDIFVPADGSVIVFIARRVRQILVEGKVKNISIRNAAEVTRPVLS